MNLIDHRDDDQGRAWNYLGASGATAPQWGLGGPTISTGLFDTIFIRRNPIKPLAAAAVHFVGFKSLRSKKKKHNNPRSAKMWMIGSKRKLISNTSKARSLTLSLGSIIFRRFFKKLRLTQVKRDWKLKWVLIKTEANHSS